MECFRNLQWWDNNLTSEAPERRWLFPFTHKAYTWLQIQQNVRTDWLRSFMFVSRDFPTAAWQTIRHTTTLRVTDLKAISIQALKIRLLHTTKKVHQYQKTNDTSDTRVCSGEKKHCCKVRVWIHWQNIIAEIKTPLFD